MEKFRQTRESKREERKKETAAGRSRQTQMEDFFRVTRKREKVTIMIIVKNTILIQDLKTDE